MKKVLPFTDGGCLGAAVFATYGFATGDMGLFVIEWLFLMFCLGFSIVGRMAMRGGE